MGRGTESGRTRGGAAGVRRAARSPPGGVRRRGPHPLRNLGDRYYNFWQDEENPRGLWRRTTLEEYRKPAPDWEVVLDFDGLGRAEGERWVFAGAPGLVPGYDRALVCLSRGGADAVVVREFDLVARRFVEGGFALVLIMTIALLAQFFRRARRRPPRR